MGLCREWKLFQFLCCCPGKIESEKYKQYFYNFEWPWYMPNKDDYIKLISDSGFDQYSVTEVNRDRYFKNTDEMIKWIDQPSIVPFISILPEEIKKSFAEMSYTR